ncbi:MAG TPA: MBL fold metallo-hydrolase [Verrucomicrobiae bacterium]|nr:MBL fold metallo-hydrolase [Verrucomicrobiae bacterium]
MQDLFAAPRTSQALRFAMLGSGSQGNGTLIQSGSTTILIDCGFMIREAEARLRRLGVAPHDVSAIVVTHEHFDHIGGVARFARKHRVPVWLTDGTSAGWKDAPVPRNQRVACGEAFTVGDLRIEPFAVPHDAREPSHFVVGNGSFRVGVLSDAGSVTDAMRAALSGCDALMLEFNHDVDMLENGPYEPPLKRRVGGPLGHLSNMQAAELVTSIDIARLRHLVLTHLSQKNNTPELALAAALGALGVVAEREVVCAHQDAGLDWRVLQ